MNRKIICPEGVQFQGHRGARGLLPENTLPSFIKTLDLGLSGFEFDVVISADKQVVVSHEAWMRYDICRKPDGSSFSKEEGEKLLFYGMEYDEIRKFDCGSKGKPLFPTQTPLAAHKPLLSELISTCEHHSKNHNLAPVWYNIEVKVEPERDGEVQPPAEEFALLIYNVIKKFPIQHRVIIQSFDNRLIKAMHNIDADVFLSLLVKDDSSLEENLAQLDFTPNYYGPNFEKIDQNLVDAVKEKGMKLIAWTVNELEDMERLMALGTHIIVTDYPDRAVSLLNAPKRKKQT